MGFWPTIRALLRRWQVAVPVLTVSFGLAVGVYLVVHTKYESTGSIVLTSPTSGARVTTGATGPTNQVNPLLAFDASLTTSATILIQKLQDPALHKQLVSRDQGAGYEVGNGKLAGPFVVVVAHARTPAQAQDIVTRVLDRARAELRDSQQALNAPASTFITPVPVVEPAAGEPKTSGKISFAAAALALGFATSLTSAYAIDSYSRSRRKKRSRQRAHQALQQPQRGPDSSVQPTSSPSGNESSLVVKR